MPLHVEILYNEYNFVGAPLRRASLLALLALVTLVLKAWVEDGQVHRGTSSRVTAASEI